MLRIHISDVNGKPAVCFDTGLDPRSFARTKMSQCLIEPGYIVYPDGTSKVWKASGVNELDGYMRVWGPPFTGERLDLLISKADSSLRAEFSQAAQQAVLQMALNALVYWIRAKLLLGETHSALNPGAAIICCKDNVPGFPKGGVFFSPENLSQRCLFVEGVEFSRFICPDLKDMEAAAFCAGAMLYKILSNTHPYSDMINFFQDMREGVFLPPHLVSPGLDEGICNLIKAALMLPVEKKRIIKSGTEILSNLLNRLMDKEGRITSVSSLFRSLTEEEKIHLEKEKNRYSTGKKLTVKTVRFISRNKQAIIGITASVLFMAFVIGSITKSRSNLPSTAGLHSDTVVATYYEAFSSLDHTFMEACIMGADKTDVEVAMNLFIIDRVRQSQELRITTTLIPARIWRQQGNQLPAPDVFGITDISIEHISGNERDGRVTYRAEYTLWFPSEPFVSYRSDELTLRRDRKRNWRITEIKRAER